MKARNAVMDGVSPNHRISFFEGNAKPSGGILPNNVPLIYH
ncbi:MAG: hypothetical protein WD059_09555 [Balneolaceae bacterium]